MSEKYYCKWCGNSYPSVYNLTHSTCNKNSGGKYHELYEGSEKTKYVCKWCGNSYPSIYNLTHSTCNKNKNSKYHEPAL